jgi:hypothetical protein
MNVETSFWSSLGATLSTKRRPRRVRRLKIALQLAQAFAKERAEWKRLIDSPKP